MSIDEIIQQPGEKERSVVSSVMDALHVAAPGEILSYNSETRTATVQLTIRRNGSTEKPAVLQDVPVFFPGNLLFPVKSGDECLMAFADTCIDAWFGQSGVASASLDRKHDLSDGFAFVGFFSRGKASGGVNVLDVMESVDKRLKRIERALMPESVGDLDQFILDSNTIV